MGRRRKRVEDLNLPNRVYLRRGVYFYECPATRTWKRLGTTLRDVDAGLKSLGVDQSVMPASHLGAIFTTARRNARTRGIAFEITRGDLEEMWNRSRGRCELTRLRFDVLRIPDCRRRPMAPSIDRISAAGIYEPANCRLVCVAVNLAVNEWGEEVFSQLAKGYLRARAAKISDKA